MQGNASKDNLGTLPIIFYPLGSFLLGVAFLSFLPISTFAPLIAVVIVGIGLALHKPISCERKGTEAEAEQARLGWIDWYKTALPIVAVTSVFAFMFGCAMSALLAATGVFA